MSKKTETPVPAEIDIMTADPTTLTREQLKARYDANMAERRRLAEENKVIGNLYKSATSTEKNANKEARIAALTAQLEALRNPSPSTSSPADPVPSVESVAIEG
jgi:hypothetical protein